MSGAINDHPSSLPSDARALRRPHLTVHGSPMKNMSRSMNSGLDPGISYYLDLVRLLAALSVFGFHLGYGKFVGGPFASLHVFGSNAVIVFFVLSGFVISHVLSTSETNARAYAVARLSRLYSVVVPALFIVALLDTFGARAAPDLYVTPLTGDSFVADLFFVNALWNHASTFGSMSTYWSLGYEAPYYVIAGLFVWGWPR